ncbi:MAG: cysteine desulfuration protein SufE [Sandaracinus sp.]|nr:cysteine desulfuration protein SufE [Sandaracinus sp.]
MQTLDDVRETFAFLDDWTEKYRYLIELGGELEPMPDELKVDEHKVKGCMSQVWLVGTVEDGRMQFLADSDAHIVRGLVALVLMIFGGKTPAEARDLDAKAVLAELDLDKHLSPGRSNGLHSMIGRIQSIATATA